MPGKSGGRSVVRLQVGVASRAQATALCGKLKAHAQPCVAVNSEMCIRDRLQEAQSQIERGFERGQGIFRVLARVAAVRDQMNQSFSAQAGSLKRPAKERQDVVTRQRMAQCRWSQSACEE